MDNLHQLFTNPPIFTLFAFCGILIGMSKMGFPGINIIATPILIYYLNVKVALAISLVVLYAGDLTAVIHYRHSFDKKIYFKFVTWALVGVLLSGIVGNFLDRQTFIITIASIVIFFAILMIYQQSIAIIKVKRGTTKHVSTQTPKKSKLKIISTDIFFGTLSGIASMLANSSGPLTSMYLLMLGISKKQFIGSGAFLYLTYNTAKIFVLIFIWKSLTLNVFLYALTLIPFSILGAYLAKFLSHYISETIYRWVILLLVIFAAISMLILI